MLQLRIFESSAFRQLHAMALSQALLKLLVGRQHDPARDDTLSVLYALVSRDLEAFASQVLPTFVSSKNIFYIIYLKLK